jgi:hypothetical protein
MTTEQRIKKAQHHFKSGWMYSFKPKMITYDIGWVKRDDTYEVFDWSDAVMRSSMNTWGQVREFLTTGQTTCLNNFHLD